MSDQEKIETAPSQVQITTFAEVMGRMGYLFSRVAGKQLEAQQFSKPEMVAIDVLGRAGACRMGFIAEQLNVGQSAITPLVDRLEEKKLVHRVRSEADRRVWLVELSDEGQKVFEKAKESYLKFSEQMLVALNDEERDTLIGLMDRITEEVAAQFQPGCQMKLP